MWNWIRKIWPKKRPRALQKRAVPRRRIVDTESIRARIQGVGWQLLEVPVRRRETQTQEVYIAEWRLTASRGYQSLQASGPDIDEAMKNQFDFLE